MNSVPTICVSTLTDVYHTLLEGGIDPEVLERQSGISQADIADPDKRVSVTKLETVWDMAKQFTNDPAIGLSVGGKVDPNRFSVVTQASFQCENIKQGLSQYIRFFSIVNQGARMELSVQDDLASLGFSFVLPEYYSISEMERMISSALARYHYLVGNHLQPVRFNFQHKMPEYVERYRVLFDAPLFFEQAKTEILFDRRLLDLKIKQSNPYLLSVLTNYAEKLLKRVQSKKAKSKPEVKDKVSHYIRKHLADDVELDVNVVAAALNMSRHTLYRKLKKEDVSFQSLVEEERRKAAIRHLQDENISIGEVAFLLGFSELSAFSRAFKRWTGESPAQYRANGQR
jgi:AraC-like DNA-binding protein